MMCEGDLDACGLPADAPERNALRLRDPMSAEEDLMRTTMLPSVLRAARHNARQRVRDIALFDIGRVFLPGDGPLPHEPLRLAVLATGSIMTSRWNVPEEQAEVDYYWLKGVIEQLARALYIEELDFERTEHPSMKPGICAAVLLGGERIGVLGEVSDEVREAWDLPGATFIAEIDMEALVGAANLQAHYRPIPRLPAALRDLAVVVPDGDAHSAAALEEAVRASAGEALESVEVFDVYTDDERLGAGNRQVALRLSFRLPDRTLTDAEVDEAMQTVTDHLARTLGAKVRSW